MLSNMYHSKRIITSENLKEDLEILLEKIDLDFTGANGEEYYTEDNNISQLDSALKEARKELNNNTNNNNNTEDIIKYVLDKCKSYSSNYYSHFLYDITKLGEDRYKVLVVSVHNE